jgi:hypothetical protein
MQTRQAGLEGTGEIRLRELVKQSLRMRPSRMMGMETRCAEVSRATSRPRARIGRDVRGPERPSGRALTETGRRAAHAARAQDCLVAA